MEKRTNFGIRTDSFTGYMVLGEDTMDCSGGLSNNFDFEYLHAYISQHEDVRCVYDSALLLGVEDFEDTIVLTESKFGIVLNCFRSDKKSYVVIESLQFHISLFDTEENIVMWDSLPKLSILGNTREYKFTHKTIPFITIPKITEVTVEEDAFEGIRFTNPELLYSHHKLGDTRGYFVARAMRNCVFEFASYLDINIIYYLREKGNRVESGCYLTSLTTTQLTTFKDEVAEVCEYVEHIEGIYLSLINCSTQSLHEFIYYLKDYAMENKIAVTCSLGIHTLEDANNGFDWYKEQETEFLHFI